MLPDETAGLTITQLAAGYGKATVLRDVTFSVEPGEIVGVAGPNGAGKTTLMRVLSGLVEYSASTASYQGAKLPADPVRACELGIIHVPEGRRLFPNLTVEENLRVGAIGGGVAGYRHALTTVLDALPGVVPMLKQRAGVLSGGQQQLVAVARGLIARPKLLLIDELSLGLSPRAVKEVTSATLTSCRAFGASVLWVDQNIGLLSRSCSRVLLLEEGSVRQLDASPGSDLGSTYF